MDGLCDTVGCCCRGCRTAQLGEATSMCCSWETPPLPSHSSSNLLPRRSDQLLSDSTASSTHNNFVDLGHFEPCEPPLQKNMTTSGLLCTMQSNVLSLETHAPTSIPCSQHRAQHHVTTSAEGTMCDVGAYRCVHLRQGLQCSRADCYSGQGCSWRILLGGEARAIPVNLDLMALSFAPCIPLLS